MPAWVTNSQTGQQEYTNPSTDNITANAKKKKQGLQQTLPGFAGEGQEFVNTPGGTQRTYNPNTIRKEAPQQASSPSVSTGIQANPDSYTTREKDMFGKISELNSQSSTLASRLNGIMNNINKAKAEVDTNLAGYKPTIDLKGQGFGGYVTNTDTSKTSDEWLQGIKDKLADFSYDTSPLKTDVAGVNTAFADNFDGYGNNFLPDTLEGGASASDLKSRLAMIARARDTGLLGEQKLVDSNIGQVKNALDTVNTDVTGLDDYIKTQSIAKEDKVAQDIIAMLNADRENYSGLNSAKAKSDADYAEASTNFNNELKEWGTNANDLSGLVNNIINSGVDLNDDVIYRVGQAARDYEALAALGNPDIASLNIRRNTGLTNDQLNLLLSGAKSGNRNIAGEVYQAPIAVAQLRKAIAAEKARRSGQSSIDAFLSKYS